MSDADSTFYLQPHLLTKVTLIRLLEQKCMNLKHLNIMSKEQLIDLFQHIALPLPQRKYRQNRRGKLLTKLQNEKEGSERRSTDSSCTSVTYGFSDKYPSKSSVNSGIGDRLKPPPDAVNFERRKIRLSSNSRSNDLDHIQIKKRKSDSSNGYVRSSEQAMDRKHEKSLSSRSREEHSDRSHKVVLKRSKSASSKESDASEQEPSKKKDKKPITWP